MRTRAHSKYAMSASRSSPARADSYQRYVMLSHQQENIRRRLSLQIPSPTPMTAVSPETHSLSSSPTNFGFTDRWTAEPASAITPTTSSRPIPTHPGVAHRPSPEDLAHEEKLYEINHQIKATLTELLNTEDVRHDDKFRAWIQQRLLDAELELRRQRRRRSSIDREMVASIAEHFEANGYSYSP